MVIESMNSLWKSTLRLAVALCVAGVMLEARAEADSSRETPAPTPRRPTRAEVLSDYEAQAWNVESIVDLAQQPDDRQPMRQPDDEPPPPPARVAQPRRSLLASAFGPSPRLSRVPSMFGDFFGGTPFLATISQPSRQIVLDFMQQPPGNANGNIQPTTATTMTPIVFGNIISSFGGRQFAPTAFTSTEIQDVIGPVNVNDSFPLNPPDAALQAAVSAEANNQLGPGTTMFNGGTATATSVDADPLVTNGDEFFLAQDVVFTPAPIVVLIPGGGALRRARIAENNSPEPRDRCYFTYNFYNDVIGGIGDVNRYVFGCERTFLNGMASLEVRLPFASTLDHDQQTNGIVANGTEFGNLTAILKVLMRESDTWLWSMGVGFGAPTADNISIRRPGGPTILESHNRSVHVLPYMSILATPNERFFWQAFVQLDVDANGNPVVAAVPGGRGGGGQGGGGQGGGGGGAFPQPIAAAGVPGGNRIGVLQDQTILFADLNVGFFAYENAESEGITAVAPMVELHYAGTLRDSDRVAGNGIAVTNIVNRYNVTNVTAGMTIFWNNTATIRPAIVVPMGTGTNRQFDYEAGVQVNIAR